MRVIVHVEYHMKKILKVLDSLEEVCNIMNEKYKDEFVKLRPSSKEGLKYME